MTEPTLGSLLTMSEAFLQKLCQIAELTGERYMKGAVIELAAQRAAVAERGQTLAALREELAALMDKFNEAEEHRAALSATVARVQAVIEAWRTDYSMSYVPRFTHALDAALKGDGQ